MSHDIEGLARRLAACVRCPRLARHVAGFRDDPAYWARPVPGFGDPQARLLVLGLAPGAHGANRTGRPFTGDGAGILLYQALHDVGCASLPESRHKKDGLKLRDVWISNAVRCVPPQNRPSGAEVTACRDWLEEELALLPRLKVVLALGRVAHDAWMRLARKRNPSLRLLDHAFGHGAVHPLAPALVDTYHPSRYNVNTGRITLPMLRTVLRRARALVVP